MSAHTTLRVGGLADMFFRAEDTKALAAAVQAVQRAHAPCVLLGEGSNVCVADAGVRGLVIQNACAGLQLGQTTLVDCGFNMMRLAFLAVRAGLGGLEWAIGIPGTVGGALVSNAGAYRGNIGPLVRRLEVVEQGERKWVGPEWMEFSYRNSRLRCPDAPFAALLQVELALAPCDSALLRARARDYQRQRIAKQPWIPSAGSYFKNINSSPLAASLPGLPAALKQAGVVPAAFLAEACSCKGLRIGDAGVSMRHANFIVNYGSAAAADIRRVANTVRQRVRERFGVELEAEVLSLGDWEEAD